MTSSHSSARQKAVTQSGISLYSLTNKVFLFHDRGRTSGNRSGRGGEPSARSCCRIRVSEGLNIITLQRFLSLSCEFVKFPTNTSELGFSGYEWNVPERREGIVYHTGCSSLVSPRCGRSCVASDFHRVQTSDRRLSS